MTTMYSLIDAVICLLHSSSHFHCYDPKNRPWAKGSPMQVWCLQNLLHAITTAILLCCSVELEYASSPWICKGNFGNKDQRELYLSVFESREASNTVWGWEGIRWSRNENEAAKKLSPVAWWLKDFYPKDVYSLIWTCLLYVMYTLI